MVNVLSADMPYADIAFFVIVALGLILGIIRGFSKSFKGLFLTVAIMLSSLLLLTPTFASARQLDVFANMESSITTKIEDSNDLCSKKINVHVDENGNKSYWVVVTNESGSSEQLLENSMGDGLMSSLKGKFALWLAKTFIQESGQTIGQVAGVFLSDVIVAIVLFVVYCIALGIICWLLRTLFAKMHTSDSKVLVGIDRTCGAIISTAFALVFIMVVLAILNSLKGKIPTVDSAIESSTVCKYFYENNPIAKLFAEIFG